MIVLGIDQSLSATGFAVIDYKDEDKYEYLSIGVLKPPKKLNVIERIAYIVKELLKTAEEYEIDYVCIEELMTPRLKSMHTAQVLSGLFYIILYELSKYYAIVSVYPSAWKKQVGVVGSNRIEQKESSKRLATKLAKSKVPIKSDDIADAICLAYFGAIQDNELIGIDKEEE